VYGGGPRRCWPACWAPAVGEREEATDLASLKCATVGDRSAIGAGSVVRQNVPSDAIAAGNPCTVLRLLGQRQ
jgi:hypothetical protein